MSSRILHCSVSAAVASFSEVLVSLLLLAPLLLLTPPSPHVSTISGVPPVVSIIAIAVIPVVAGGPDVAGIPAVTFFSIRLPYW
jgi:hypothetical protein